MNKLRLVCGFIAFVIALGVFTSFPKDAYACSCAVNDSVMEERDRNDAVFEGTATAVKKPVSLFSTSSASKVKTTFQVNELWKGRVSSRIEVTSALSGASCGFEFQEGQRYLVYARSTGNSLDVSLCSRTALFSSAGHDIVELGQGTVPPQSMSDMGGSSPYIWWIAAVTFILVGVFAVWIVMMQKRKHHKSG